MLFWIISSKIDWYVEIQRVVVVVVVVIFAVINGNACVPNKKGLFDLLIEISQLISSLSIYTYILIGTAKCVHPRSRLIRQSRILAR